MQSTNGSGRARKLQRNPLYQLMRRNNWRSDHAAKQAGYCSVSAFYKALRFERMPEGERLTKIAKLLRMSEGDTFSLWRKEMAR